MDNSGFESGKLEEILLFSKDTYGFSGPTEPHVQWVRACFVGCIGAGREVNHSPTCSAKIKNGVAIHLLALYAFRA